MILFMKILTFGNFLSFGFARHLNYTQHDLSTFFEKTDGTMTDSLPMLNYKIFRGARVTATEHPYVASVRRSYAHYCSGAVLTKNLVLTVAHPLYLVDTSELGVVVGENYSDRGTAVLTVVALLIHHEYDPFSMKNDIAVLRTYQDIIYKVSVKPIALAASRASLEGLTAFVTGWGRCDRTGKELCLPRSTKYLRGELWDPMLRTVKFSVATNSPHCNAYGRSLSALQEKVLCVGPAREDDPMCPCMAVPGAPLVVNSRLVGLLSWGLGCSYTTDLPLIYTDIRQHQRWFVHNVPILKKITKKNFTMLFKATKARLLSEWLKHTRLFLPMKSKSHSRDLHMVEVDSLLSQLQGMVFDVRDFVDGGRYHNQKGKMYDELRNSELKMIAAREGTKRRMFDAKSSLDMKPFLSNETLGEADLVVKNGTVYDTETTTFGEEDVEESV